MKHWIGTLPYRGWGRSCPVCAHSSRRFLPHGNPPRAEARCVHCGALERHRFAWKYLHEQTDLFDEDELRRPGLLRGGYLFMCRKAVS